MSQAADDEGDGECSRTCSDPTGPLSIANLVGQTSDNRNRSDGQCKHQRNPLRIHADAS